MLCTLILRYLSVIFQFLSLVQDHKLVLYTLHRLTETETTISPYCIWQIFKENLIAPKFIMFLCCLWTRILKMRTKTVPTDFESVFQSCQIYFWRVKINKYLLSTLWNITYLKVLLTSMLDHVLEKRLELLLSWKGNFNTHLKLLFERSIRYFTVSFSDTSQHQLWATRYRSSRTVSEILVTFCRRINSYLGTVK